MCSSSAMELSEDGLTAQRRKLDLAEFNVNLHGVVTKWLKKHGKGFKPKLSADQKEDLASVFKLMDEDGSGAIDVDELGAAFQMLGFNLKRSEILGFMAEVDHDHTGELEYNEFLEVMTESLARLSDKMMLSNRGNQSQVPLTLMTTAYKRKKLLRNILTNTPESLAQVVQCELDLVAAAKTKEKEAASAELRSHRSDGSVPLSSALQRASQHAHLSPHMLMDLKPEELRCVASITRKAELTSPDTAPAKRGAADRSSYNSPRPLHLPFLAPPRPRAPEIYTKPPQIFSPRATYSVSPAERFQPGLSPRMGGGGGGVPSQRTTESSSAAQPQPRADSFASRRAVQGIRASSSRSLDPHTDAAPRHTCGQLSLSNAGDSPLLRVERSSCSNAAPRRPASFTGHDLQSMMMPLPLKGSRVPRVFKAASSDKLPMLEKGHPSW